jgi:cytochrome c oxidase subunit IV
MTETAAKSPYRIYWVTWLILLVITVAMLLAEKFHMPRWFLVLFLLAFMAVKAAMIGGNFMHLRYEHRRITVMVAVGIVVTSLVLLTMLAPESRHVRARTTAPAPAVSSPEGHE